MLRWIAMYKLCVLVSYIWKQLKMLWNNSVFNNSFDLVWLLICIVKKIQLFIESQGKTSKYNKRKLQSFILCNKVYTVGEAQDREIMLWENVIADAYTQRLKRDRENSMETKVFEISERYLIKTKCVERSVKKW